MSSTQRIALNAAPIPDDERRRTVLLSGVLTVTALSIVVAALMRWGPDWPAQEFRAWVAAHDGLSVFTTRWYSGLALLGYSVLYPVLAVAFGPAILGAASCVVITWAACGMAPSASRARAILFGIAVAVSTVENLLIGQVPFLMGAAFGIVAVRAALGRRHWALVASCALLASLCSPLAGAFVIMVAPAIAVQIGWRRATAFATGVGGAVIASIVGGADGPFPCQWQALAHVAVLFGALLIWTPAPERAWRTFALCYLIAALAAFLIPNPIGSNIERLGKLMVVPLICCFLPLGTGWIRARTAVIAVMALIWPGQAFVSSMADGAADPGRHEQFYSGLMQYLHQHGDPSGRTEVVFTHGHWEAYFVARTFPIARGWERQSDLQYNQVLYHPITAAGYRQWLDANAVNLVALPNAPIDYGGHAEAVLLRNPPSYLEPAWHDANWQVWRVRHPAPLVTGTAQLVFADQAAIQLRFTGAGSAVVRVRGGKLWQPDGGGACAETTPAGWLLVRAKQAGPVTIRAQLNSSLLAGTDRCVP